MRRPTTIGFIALGVLAAGIGAQALAAGTSRPLQPLTASAGAKRNGPCFSGIGVVPDGGCPGGGRPKVAGCDIFPSDNAWNLDVSGYPRHPNSDNYISFVESTRQVATEAHLFMGVGANGEATGMPFIVVPANQPPTQITYDLFGNESDPGPFPIPTNAPVEPIGDRHVIALQQGTCKLFELYNARVSGGGWVANSGARWDLSSNARRPDRIGSADAAGLPIFPGIAKYDEVASGAINHALRITVRKTSGGFIYPATHFAATTDSSNGPPMGLRLRLRADFDRSRYAGQSRIILDALAKYGAIVADNGFNWILFGDKSDGWDSGDLSQLWTVPGTAFEAVDTGPIHT